MDSLPRQVATDHGRFRPEDNNPEALYGLPQEIKYCRSCVISNQRPNSTVEFKHQSDSKKQTINFDDDGVCDACRHATHKEDTDWDERRRKLEELCDRYRRSDGHYDCLVPGSGGKDSFYQAHILKHKYGMNPLTTTWAPHIYTDWGWHNFQAWIHAGFDNVLFTPNGRVHRLLTRLAFEKLLHPFQPFVLGQKNLAPKIAMQNDIKLIFYGENEAEYGNAIADNENATRDQSYFTAETAPDMFLGGVSIADLACDFDISQHDVKPYLPADPKLVQEAEVVIHYLGYYEKWHPQSAYYYAVENGGFQASPERTPGTYSKYNGIDDKIDDLHYYTTWIKFGIGRATYDSAQEIRNDDITRDEGKALVNRFDGEFPERFIDEIFTYLSLPPEEFPVASKMFEQPMMDRAYFDHLCDRFRSPHIWMWQDDDWKLRREISAF
jgi:N-acetyl sugar amidotransferase